VTHLRQLMLDELERRNYSPSTVRSYLHAVEEFARHFGRSPEQLGPDHVRQYQVHLFRDRKLSARTIAGQTAALRFLFVKTLRRPYLPDALPFPKHSRRLPTVLSQEEVARLIDASGKLCSRTRRILALTHIETASEPARFSYRTVPCCGHVATSHAFETSQSSGKDAVTARIAQDPGALGEVSLRVIGTEEIDNAYSSDMLPGTETRQLSAQTGIVSRYTELGLFPWTSLWRGTHMGSKTPV